MSNSVVQAGSPLDDYFNCMCRMVKSLHVDVGEEVWTSHEIGTDVVVDEVEMQSSSSNQASAGHVGAEEAGDTVSPCPSQTRSSKLIQQTLVDNLCDASMELQQGEKGWTGLIPNVSSSSRSPPTSPPRHSHAPVNTSDEKQQEMEVFGERLKYMLCTSGLLEKVYVPCLGGSIPVRKEEEEDVDIHKNQDRDVGLGDDDAEALDHWRTQGVQEMEVWLEKMRERPDITFAGLVLLVAMAWVVGWKVFLFVSVSGLGAAGVLWKRRITGLPLSSSDQVSDCGHVLRAVS